MVPGLCWQQVPVAAAWESTGSGEQTADMAGEAARTAWCLAGLPWITYDL